VSLIIKDERGKLRPLRRCWPNRLHPSFLLWGIGYSVQSVCGGGLHRILGGGLTSYPRVVGVVGVCALT